MYRQRTLLLRTAINNASTKMPDHHHISMQGRTHSTQPAHNSNSKSCISNLRSSPHPRQHVFIITRHNVFESLLSFIHHSHPLHTPPTARGTGQTSPSRADALSPS
ncbi:hypothetical protein NX059_001586 [Plenodomus lindquistii]|nr:hypothetical protein NX059_001586 [Plenodomus lindquistii]